MFHWNIVQSREPVSDLVEGSSYVNYVKVHSLDRQLPSFDLLASLAIDVNEVLVICEECEVIVADHVLKFLESIDDCETFLLCCCHLHSAAVSSLLMKATGNSFSSSIW